MYKKIQIFEINIDTLALEDFLSQINLLLEKKGQSVVSNVNIHALCLAYKNTRLVEFFRSSEIVFCDGFGVRVAARMLGYTPPERYTPPDFINQLVETCSTLDYSVFFLGANPGVASRAAEVLMKDHPSLKIAGTHHGYYDKRKDSEENRKVVDLINKACPDLLFIGFGMPDQEYWIEDNKDGLNAKVIMPVGALIDYVAGQVRRTPHWMTDHGLEWLGRFLIEPGRLWKRYFFEIPKFFILVLKEAYTNKYLHNKKTPC